MSDKKCPEGKILNPKTNRCINAPKAKTFKVKEKKIEKPFVPSGPPPGPHRSPSGPPPRFFPPSPFSKKKQCPEGKILNPKTNRCVKDPEPKAKTFKVKEPKQPIEEITNKSLTIGERKELSEKERDIKMILKYLDDDNFINYSALKNIKIISRHFFLRIKMKLNHKIIFSKNELSEIDTYIQINKQAIGEYIKAGDSLESLQYDLLLASREYKMVIDFFLKKHPELFAEFDALEGAFAKVTYIRNHKEKWIKETESLSELYTLIDLPKEKESQDKLPESVSNSVSTFLDSLNSIQMNTSSDIKNRITYSGMGGIDQWLLYLRLLKKYKNDCILYNDKGRIFRDDFDEKEYNQLANDIVNCVNRGIELFIIPFSFLANDAIAKISNAISHANMLIYRVNHKENGDTVHTIEHFEPHGVVTTIGNISNVIPLSKKLKNIVQKLQSKVKLIYEKTGNPNIEMEYISPREVCPNIMGLQQIQDIGIKKTWGGFCGLWSMFFAEMIIRNPSVSSNVMYTILLKFARNDPVYLNNIMHGYLIDLNRDLYEMFGTIFGIQDKSLILKVITNYARVQDPNDITFKQSLEKLRALVFMYYRNEYLKSKKTYNNYVDLDEELKQVEQIEKIKEKEIKQRKVRNKEQIEKDKKDREEIKKMKEKLKEQKRIEKEEKMKNKVKKTDILKKIEKVISENK